MSKYLGIHDHDEEFKSLNFPPIILNDIPASTKEEREKLNELIMTTYNNTDTLEAVPSCECGALSYGYNLGMLCTSCDTRVETPTDREIESTVWFRAPDGIISLVNPMLWMMFSKIVTKSHFNVLYWFCNPYEPNPPETNKGVNIIIRKFLSLGIPRGINSFIENFDVISQLVISCIPRPQERPFMQQFIDENRKKFFPRHLPMPSKVAFVIEKTPTGSYADPNIRDPINACLTITSLDREAQTNLKRMEGRVASVINDLAVYYHHMFGDPFGKKEGLFRKTIFGSRMGYSFRCVIVNDAGVHDYETIKLPYPQAVALLRNHLLNKLNKLGYSDKDAKAYIAMNTKEQDPFLKGLLYEIIKEAPGGDGLWCLFIRYPTLSRASIQALRINEISDYAASLSTLAIKGCNADIRVKQVAYRYIDMLATLLLSAVVVILR